MKKHLFKTRLLSFAALCGVALGFASCANDDVVQNPSNPKEEEMNKNLTAFVVGDDAKTRTSLDYESGNFYWEAGDYIYVRDDDGVLQKSRNAPTKKVASFKFMVPGKFTDHDTYKVYYLGKNINGNSVTIPSTQSQTVPGNTEHLGTSGDYGTAIANKKRGTTQFEFELEHLPTYLVFQPYISNKDLKSCYLTKVEVSSDNDIAETYTVNSTTGDLEASSGTGGKQIVLKTNNPNDWSPYNKGFSITSTASVSTNGSYMVIKSGTHALTVRYWVKDIESEVEGVITKTYPSTQYDSNTFYDMTADLKVTDYPGNNYYMWDAQEQYWEGHEWTEDYEVGQRQPTLPKQEAGAYDQDHNYPSRWYHEGSGAPFNATESCVNLPNVNEMTWYAEKGDPRWDADQLWSTMGHLHKGGMWFKKKEYIDGYNKETAVDGTDWRIQENVKSWPVSKMPPSAGDASNYFYLPALGFYENGSFKHVDIYGCYWSSSAKPSVKKKAYGLILESGNVNVSNEYLRSRGYRVGEFK